MKDIPNRYRHRPSYIRRRRFIIIGSVLASLISILVMGYFALINSTPLTVAKKSNIRSLTQPAVVPNWPKYGSGAIGAVGYDGILLSNDGETIRPIASITKIITALVVLQAKPLTGNEPGPSIKLTQNDQRIYELALAAGAAAKPVAVGSSMSEREMIEAMLLPSAANYSETLVIWAYGSVDAYLKAADNWLVANNLIQTKVVDTSGLLPENISNPNNLIGLGKLALKNTALASIVSEKKVTVPGVGDILNSNQLLGVMGINGIKTGTTYEAGACMLFSSEIKVGSDKVTIVGVLLGANDRGQQNTDIKELLTSVQPGFKPIKLVLAGQEFASYKTAWGQTSKLISKKDINAVVWSNTPVTITVQADDITTAKSGEQKGEVVIKIGTKTINQPLVVDNTISNPNVFWRIANLK